MTTDTSRPRSKAKPNAALATTQEPPPLGEGLFSALSLEELQNLFQELGLRAEITADLNGKPIISSATSGLVFNVRPGAIATGSPKDGPVTYIDFTFVVPMRIGRPMPPGVTNNWNRSKRFARLYEEPDFLCLEFDIFIAPGVTRQFVLTAIDLWNRLIGEFQQHLRNAFGAS